MSEKPVKEPPKKRTRRKADEDSKPEVPEVPEVPKAEEEPPKMVLGWSSWKKPSPSFSNLFKWKECAYREVWGYNGPGMLVFYDCTLLVDFAGFKQGTLLFSVVANLAKDHIEFQETETGGRTVTMSTILGITTLE